MSRIYVASSWRNERQPAVVAALRAAGHEVYDFKNPAPGNHGFHWSDIDPTWQTWSPFQFRAALKQDIAIDGFNRDHAAMEWADTFVMVLPCGRSAHLELGWACGAKKRTVILLDAQQEPELMYLEAQEICLTIEDVITILAPRPRRRPRCPICGKSDWCSCGYGPEHGYGRDNGIEP
jgi:hypothetical protein